MRILGISAHGHDASAALIVDGAPVAAVQEERLSRRLGDRAFPLRAIEWCLARAAVAPEALDAVVFYERPLRRFERVLTCLLRDLPRGARDVPGAIRGALGERLWVKGVIAAHLGVSGDRILFTAQHDAHAAAAFLTSPADRAAILVADGAGEWATVTAGRGERRADGTVELRPLREIRYPHSLGLLYAAFAAFLGLPAERGAGALMALAAWGRPAPDDAARVGTLLRAAPGGAFFLGPGAVDPLGARPFTRRLVELFGPPRDPRAPLDPSTPAGARWAAIAAAAQRAVEDTLVELARALRRETGLADLCLGGGVFANARANARILGEAGFARVFVSPAPGSAGGALGAALWIDRVHLRRPHRAAADDPFLGPCADGAGLARLAREDDAPCAALDADAAAERAAEALHGERVVGWMEGALELGPRTLGHRALLAVPGGAAAARLRAIKDRASFIPFSLAVTREAAGRYLVLPPGAAGLGRHLGGELLLRPEWRDRLGPALPGGAVRTQVVDGALTPGLHGLLVALERRGRPPALSITSLRLRDEPMVASAVEAYSLLRRSDLDLLVAGGVFVEQPRAPTQQRPGPPTTPTAAAEEVRAC